MEKRYFKKMGKGVYISLAVCVLLIAFAGIFASVRSINKMSEANGEILENISGNNGISDYFPVDSVKLPTVETSNGEVSEPLNEENEVKSIVWSEPVKNGKVQKQFSNGELCYSETMNDYRTHNGVDIKADNGEAVLSVGPGIITAVENDALWGMSVSVDHGNGIVTVYRNLSEVLPQGIEKGSYVEQGGILGAVSTSALVEIGEASHLHFEVYSDGKAVEPLETLSIYG